MQQFTVVTADNFFLIIYFAFLLVITQLGDDLIYVIMHPMLVLAMKLLFPPVPQVAKWWQFLKLAKGQDRVRGVQPCFLPFSKGLFRLTSIWLGCIFVHPNLLCPLEWSFISAMMPCMDHGCIIFLDPPRSDENMIFTCKSLSPFSYKKFSPKNFYLPFEHMHVVLNIIKK